MQTPFRPLRLLMAAALVTYCAACYPHVGSPYGADDQTWVEYAQNACERGDLRAHDAFMSRVDDDGISSTCLVVTDDHDSTFDDRR